ncbi:MAG: cupin domain-containing protein [Gammaproteobacteria bacterium]|jgi:mannose-6-phosphate isomerase-like protein (cupin superfamily)|nr:cupin domain-containing protein [Gammaproteobacteria bacterium]
MNDKAKPDEFWTSERCYITELLNHGQTPEVSIARTRVEPTVTTQLHSLSVAEWYVIEAGTGIMTVGEEMPRRVGAGDVVCIPRGSPQMIFNDGENDLVFLCVCAPKFSPECYTSLE